MKTSTDIEAAVRIGEMRVRAGVSTEKGKPWWWPQRCCDKAEQGPFCVCSFNTTCQEHGNRHHGTHD